MKRLSRPHTFATLSFRVGDRVEMHPATDAWMSGDRFGTVEFPAFVTPGIFVRLDKSGKLVRVLAQDIRHV